MDEHKICFIMCSNDEQFMIESHQYLSLLEVPEGYQVDTLVITDALSMAAGYNEGMKASDAKYKIYLHQDTFVRNKTFCRNILDIFHADPSIGMIGMVGTRQLSRDGVMWNAPRIGNIFHLQKAENSGRNTGIKRITDGYAEVEAVDGLMMITQHDLLWREDIITGWDFYDVSQCLEFRRAGYKIVVPGQKEPWCIHDSEGLDLSNYEAARLKILEAYPDFFRKRKSFYYCYTDNVNSRHLPWGLLELGYEVKIDEAGVHIQDYDERSKDEFARRLKESKCDYAISFNLSPEIAQACYEEGIPYVAWNYDSPLKEMYGWFAAYPTTHIFAMDRADVSRLEYKKLPHLHYMHLAGNTTMMQGLIIESGDEKKYSHQIAMVGNLYTKNFLEKVRPEEDNQIRRELDNFVGMPVGKWGREGTAGRLSDEAVAYLIKRNKINSQEKYNMDNRIFYESMLERDITHRDRVLLLEQLAQKYNVHVYNDEKMILDKVHHHPRIDPYVEAPKVFHLSKINLNITLRSIKTGIPQRVFDVMAVGGFMMSNYQQDLEELFVPDREIVLFHSIEELMEKVDYYLKHENERLAIAVAGYKKVEQYSFPRVLERIIRIVDEDIYQNAKSQNVKYRF